MLEMIIAGGLMVGMLLATGMFTYNGDKSKASNILSIMAEIGNAAVRYHADTSLHPWYPVSLFNKSYNTGSYTTENLDATLSWQGPYLKGFAPYSTYYYPLTTYASSAYAAFSQHNTSLPSGVTMAYSVYAYGLPKSLVISLVGVCNGTTYTSAASLPTSFSAGNQCYSSIGTASSGTVYYLYSAL